MDEYDSYDDLSEDDPRVEQAARELVDDNADEWIAAYAHGDLADSTLLAHENTWPSVEHTLARAKARLASVDADEAAFHYARALEGYVRAVLLVPLFDIMTRGFEDRLKISKLDVKDVIPAQLKNARRLLLFALVGIGKSPEEGIAIHKKVFAAVAPDGPWKTRNAISHSLHMPTGQEVRALEKVVCTALDAISAPLRALSAQKKACEQERAAQKQRQFDWQGGGFS